MDYSEDYVVITNKDKEYAYARIEALNLGNVNYGDKVKKEYIFENDQIEDFEFVEVDSEEKEDCYIVTVENGYGTKRFLVSKVEERIRLIYSNEEGAEFNDESLKIYTGPMSKEECIECIRRDYMLKNVDTVELINQDETTFVFLEKNYNEYDKQEEVREITYNKFTFDCSVKELFEKKEYVYDPKDPFELLKEKNPELYEMLTKKSKETPVEREARIKEEERQLKIKKAEFDKAKIISDEYSYREIRNVFANKHIEVVKFWTKTDPVFLKSQLNRTKKTFIEMVNEDKKEFGPCKEMCFCLKISNDLVKGTTIVYINEYGLVGLNYSFLWCIKENAMIKVGDVLINRFSKEEVSPLFNKIIEFVNSDSYEKSHKDKSKRKPFEPFDLVFRENNGPKITIRKSTLITGENEDIILNFLNEHEVDIPGFIYYEICEEYLLDLIGKSKKVTDVRPILYRA